MTKKPSALWFADSGTTFRGSEPYFFDRREFGWVGELESAWSTIRDELLENIRSGAALTPYMDKTLASKPDRWRTLGLLFWMRRSKWNCQKFPRTWAALSKVPNLTAASLNLLEPNTTIKPHFGNTNAIMRCHLGLIVPGVAPKCAFRVGEETRSWGEGELMMFCDAHQHTAWNNTSEDRYVLVIDVMRPEFASASASVSSRVLASIKLETLAQRNPLVRRLISSRVGEALLMTVTRALYWFDIWAFGYRPPQADSAVGAASS